jgi:hypothetical protein
VSNARIGAASLAVGLVVIASAQILAPLARPPLYDGVVVEEPYRYLSPSPGEAGAPTSYAGTQPVTGATSPAFAAATAESPPQAQLIAQAGAFTVSTVTSSLAVAITPVPPAPPDSITGNAYRFVVTDQAGEAVSVTSGSFVTLLLRAPAGLTDVSIVQLVDGVWQTLPTMRGGEPDAYDINVEALGEFAIRGVAPAVGIDFGPWSRAIGMLAALGFVLVVISMFLPTRRPRSGPADSSGRQTQPTRRPPRGN